MPSYLSLFLLFFGLSFLSIGGASSTLPEQYSYFVTVHHLLTPQQFGGLYAIAQTSPGPNVMFVAAFGYQAFGILGALICFAGMAVPSSIIAVGFEALSQLHANKAWPHIIRKALPPVAVGLMLSTGWILSYQSVQTHLWAVVILLATIYAMVRTKINPIWMISAGGLAGVLFF